VRKTTPLLLVSAILAFGATGCDQPSGAQRYSVLVGTIVGKRSEAGIQELDVRRVRPAAEGADVETCSVSEHSELYLNGRLVALAEIQLGLPVEIYGYRAADPQRERFVVSMAQVTAPRSESAPP
jgi:hypothetical protein